MESYLRHSAVPDRIGNGKSNRTGDAFMLVEKEVISPGKYWYRDEATGLPRKLTVTPDLCRYWGEQGNKMIETGLTVPVPYEHDFQAHPMTPKEKLLNNAGEVKAYHLRDILEGDPLFDPKRGPVKDSLFSSVEVQDPDVKSKIGNSIRWTSPWISSFTDGNGKEWKNVISHLALTTRPRITKQQPFPSIAAALSLARPISDISAQSNYKDGFCLTRACKINDSGEPIYPMYFSMCAGVLLAETEDRSYAGIATEVDAHPSSFVAHSASRGTSEDQGSRAKRARLSSKRAYDASLKGDSATAAEHHFEAQRHHARAAQYHFKDGRHNEGLMHANAAKKHLEAAEHHVATGRSGKGSYAKAFASGDHMGDDKEYHPDYVKAKKKAEEASEAADKHTKKDEDTLSHHEKGIDLHNEAEQSHIDAAHEAKLHGHADKYVQHRDKVFRHHNRSLMHQLNLNYRPGGKGSLAMALATDSASDEKKKKPPEKKADKKPDNPLANLEDESEEEAAEAQTPGVPGEVEEIEAVPSGMTPPAGAECVPGMPGATPDGNFPPPEELICDLLQALGVPMPDRTDETQFMRNLYEAVMSKIKELTSKGMGAANTMPDQNLPPTQQPNASQPDTTNPNLQQEQQPMMMSLQDINKLEEPLRSVALSMHQATQQAEAKSVASDKLMHSLRDSKLKEENEKRLKRVALLSRFMPKAKADLDAMIASPAMALSMGEGGAIVDPMAQTLAILEKGLQELPRAWTTDTSALSLQPQPKDDEMLTEERANDIADGFARQMGCAPLAK